jgi:hypothetical protein
VADTFAMIVATGLIIEYIIPSYIRGILEVMLRGDTIIILTLYSLSNLMVHGFGNTVDSSMTSVCNMHTWALFSIMHYVVWRFGVKVTNNHWLTMP